MMNKDSTESELVQIAAVAMCWLERHGWTKAEVISLIRHERNEQDARWGPQTNNTNGKWVAILTEEVGEVARSVLEAGTYDDKPTLVIRKKLK